MGGQVGLFGAAAVAAVGAYAVRGRSSQIFGRSIYRGPSRSATVALTFDDGPSPGTGKLLDILDRFNVKATFFQCGMHVRRLPDLAIQVAQAGHDLGNHTDTHPSLWLRQPAFVKMEIHRAQDAIMRHTLVRPRWFRPPYGVRWFGVREAQQELGLTGIMWTTIGMDWKLPATRVCERLLSGAANGAIYCLHDGREHDNSPDISNTISAVKEAIPRLRDMGLEFATVSGLLNVGRLE